MILLMKKFTCCLLKTMLVHQAKSSATEFLALLVYVDDVLITGTREDSILLVKKQLDAKFTIKDLGYMKYFLGLEIARSTDSMLIHQQKYVLDITQDTGLSGCKPALFPLPKGLKLNDESGDLLLDPNVYRRLLGKLLYLTIRRPDLSYAVQCLSQFMSSPRKPHIEVALHVVRYLKRSPAKGLYFPVQSDLSLRANCDTDWGTRLMNKRSLTGYCIFLGSSLISWKSKKQAIVFKILCRGRVQEHVYYCL
ncbi:uncharacterized mitochondrial protein AtMg00810-like [Ricinus communis]|uniref:uncharacterized mitochondrial protein AtMg00810-like n=1 Tax=Ricinus communis TaxID=3988 RepID=UPI00201AE3ED|nr:uncharacterized mitochondrial protein AtMg00810-like [Ricinus communis]